MATELRINFDDPREQAHFHAIARGLVGKKRITIIDDRPRRSDRQNRYYWPCFVQPFGDYLRKNKREFTDEMAHEVLKKMYLETSICDDNTGQVFTYVRSTTDLSTSEFNEYLDCVAAFLATDCGFKVADPEVYREKEDPNEKQKDNGRNLPVKTDPSITTNSPRHDRHAGTSRMAIDAGTMPQPKKSWVQAVRGPGHRGV